MTATGNPNTSKGAQKRALWVTYINIVLYALCYNLQRPVEPFLVKELSKNSESVASDYGKLQSFFSTIQTIGSPIVGILLDRIGLRHASAIVFASSALSYGILSHAHTMRVLFYSKIPTALQHAFLVAQAVAATSCANNEAERAQSLGRMTTAYTIGATIGPALGGVLANHGDMWFGANLAVLGSVLSVVLSLLFIPNVSSTKANTDQTTLRRPKSFLQALRHSSSIALRSNLWPLLLVKVLTGVASSMFHTALPMVLTEDQGFDPKDLGFSMSCSTFASAVLGAFGIGLLTAWLGGAMAMTKYGLFVRPMLGLLLAAVLSETLLWGFEHKLMAIIAVSVLHGLAQHIIATGLTTQTTGLVAKDEQGALLGLEHGLFSMARIGAPGLGTAILQMANFGAVAMSCAFVDGTMLLLTVLKANNSARSKEA